MKNEIMEMLKGLGEAKDKRIAKLADLANCDDTAIIEEKKAELQKEFDEKLAEFVAAINEEREKAIAKLNRDVETIEELIAENNEKLVEIEEAEKATETEGTVVDGNSEEVQEAIEGIPAEGVNPFRP